MPQLNPNKLRFTPKKKNPSSDSSDENNFSSIEWPSFSQTFKYEEAVKEAPLNISELPKVSPEDSAYIIMTSGTTGFPKGAKMYHKGAYNTISDINSRFNITNNDKVLGVSSMDFDLSVYDLFGTFSSGGSLIMIPEEKSRDAEYWLDLVEKYNITVWNSVPVLLEMLLIQAEAKNKKLPLKRVMLSGDWIGLDLPKRVNNVTDNCKFIAMGGATEASIWSNYIDVKLPIPNNWNSIPYGRPLANQSYRVVDEKGMDAPFLVEGELWIGGAGVGTYEGDNELVKKKFVQDESGIWYRTGDKGRFWNDGTIEFLGREDFQVKIRGHRIELGEIETALKSIENINKAVVEASDGSIGDKHLIGYLETNTKKEEPLYLKDEEVKEKISAFSNRDAVKMVTTKKPYTIEGTGKHVAIMDFGIKTNIIRNFKKRNCKITVFPMTATAEEVLSVNPDLVFLSNGPGDPEDLTDVIENIKKIVGVKPIVGICLGHQLLALTLGGKTTKLKFGHRGCNHPVKDLERNRVHITSQNHGYVVDELPESVIATHLNINDGTVEGMKHTTLPIYSVQFHPEAAAGPKDSEYIFDRFMEYAL